MKVKGMVCNIFDCSAIIVLNIGDCKIYNFPPIVVAKIGNSLTIKSSPFLSQFVLGTMHFLISVQLLQQSFLVFSSKPRNSITEDTKS